MKSKDSFIISYNPIYTLESSQTEIFSIASGIQKRVKKVPFRKYFMRFFSLFRVSLTLSCPMTLELFPLDTQVCFLRVASCKCIFASIHASISSLRIFYLYFKDGWTTNDVIYTWKLPDPVQFVSNLFLPGGFELDGYISDNCDITTNTGLYFTKAPCGVSQVN